MNNDVRRILFVGMIKRLCKIKWSGYYKTGQNMVDQIQTFWKAFKSVCIIFSLENSQIQT